MHNVTSLYWKLEPIPLSCYIICNCVHSFKHIRGLQNVTKDLAMEVLIITRLYIMTGSCWSSSKSLGVHHNSGIRYMISLYSICMSYCCDYTVMVYYVLCVKLCIMIAFRGNMYSYEILMYSMVCSKSSWNEGMKQHCIGQVKCCLSDLAAWLFMQAILLQVDQMFCSVFITGFVSQCAVVLPCWV